MKKAASITGSDVHVAIRHHLGTGDRVYGIVDAARDRELALAAPKQFGQTIHWLFEDGSAAHMLHVAPYLVPIAYRSRYPYNGSGYLDLWAERLDTSAGILLITPAEGESLRKHLGGLFRVTDEEDHRYFFRFYDPRVLRTYLPTCTAGEAVEFFGPVRWILVESGRPGVMLACRAGQGGADVKEMTLKPGAVAGPRGAGER